VLLCERCAAPPPPSAAPSASYNILHEYKLHNAHIVVRQDISVDEFIDVLEGNRKYIRCLYVYNKVRRSTACAPRLLPEHTRTPPPRTPGRLSAFFPLEVGEWVGAACLPPHACVRAPHTARVHVLSNALTQAHHTPHNLVPPPQIDSVTIEDVDRMARFANSTVISVHMKLNMEVLLEKMWEYLGMVRGPARARTRSCGCRYASPPPPFRRAVVACVVYAPRTRMRWSVLVLPRRQRVTVKATMSLRCGVLLKREPSEKSASRLPPPLPPSPRPSPSPSPSPGLCTPRPHTPHSCPSTHTRDLRITALGGAGCGLRGMVVFRGGGTRGTVVCAAAFCPDTCAPGAHLHKEARVPARLCGADCVDPRPARLHGGGSVLAGASARAYRPSCPRSSPPHRGCEIARREPTIRVCLGTQVAGCWRDVLVEAGRIPPPPRCPATDRTRFGLWSELRAFPAQIHKSLRDLFKVALVWGQSTKHNPQHCGLKHSLRDEDVIQVCGAAPTLGPPHTPPPPPARRHRSENCRLGL
jgi:hypothetical protein